MNNRQERTMNDLSPYDWIFVFILIVAVLWVVLR